MSGGFHTTFWKRYGQDFHIDWSREEDVHANTILIALQPGVTDVQVAYAEGVMLSHGRAEALRERILARITEDIAFPVKEAAR